MMSGDTIVTPPTICGFAEVELAHQQMRTHRACRVDRCAWKWVAYYTLVHHGRIAPQELSPRERAHLRGLDYPADATDRAAPDGTPEPQTFQQVIDGLAQLALPPTHSGSGGES